jgi:hypothetical protein
MEDPEATAGPAPLYRYQLYVNTEDPGLRDGRYWPTPASLWTTDTGLNRETIRAILDAQGLEPDINQYYLMIAVQGIDEAGNVEPWLREVPYWDDAGVAGAPGDPLFNDPLQPVDFRQSDPADPQVERRRQWASELPNIRRFQWTGTEAPETRVSPVFWHGDGSDPVGAPDERLGSNLRVVMPEEGSGQTVDAEFIIGADFRDRTNLRIIWELYAGNELIDSSQRRNEQDRTEYRYPTISPDDAAHNPVEVFDLGDPARRSPITYTFRAAAYVDANEDRVYSPGDAIDPTWANVSFVVTPYSVDPGLDPLDQPIKATEEQ